MKQYSITVPSDRVLVVSALFDAPRDMVWKTYNDPNMVPEWWGPEELTTTVQEMDVRPGGKWRVVQREPDGQEYAFKGEYSEVVAPQWIKTTYEIEESPAMSAIETIMFEEQNGCTKITERYLFQAPEHLQHMLQIGLEEEVAAGVGRLAALLEELQKG